MKLVTEILGGSQAETVKEEPVKPVTEILGGSQAETVKEGQGMKRIDPEFYPMIPVIVNGLIAITAIVVERLF